VAETAATGSVLLSPWLSSGPGPLGISVAGPPRRSFVARGAGPRSESLSPGPRPPLELVIEGPRPRLGIIVARGAPARSSLVARGAPAPNGVRVRGDPAPLESRASAGPRPPTRNGRCGCALPRPRRKTGRCGCALRYFEFRTKRQRGKSRRKHASFATCSRMVSSRRILTLTPPLPRRALPRSYGLEPHQRIDGPKTEFDARSKRFLFPRPQRADVT